MTNGQPPDAAPAYGSATTNATKLAAEALLPALEALDVEHEALSARLAAIGPERKHLRKIYDQLTGATPPPGTPGRKPKAVTNQPVAKSGKTKIGEERLAAIKNAIVKMPSDEFRQVDVRNTLPGINSSVTAVAFEQLRQDGWMRLARKEGNNKYYRLTPMGLADREAEA